MSRRNRRKAFRNSPDEQASHLAGLTTADRVSVIGRGEETWPGRLFVNVRRILRPVVAGTRHLHARCGVGSQFVRLSGEVPESHSHLQVHYHKLDTPIRHRTDSNSMLHLQACRFDVYFDLWSKFISRMACSGMLRRVDLVRADVSEEPSVSFIRVKRIGKLGTTLAVTSNRRTFLRSLRRLLLTARVVPSSPNLPTLMKEALSSSNTPVLTRATRPNISEDGILHSLRSEDQKLYMISIVLTLCISLSLLSLSSPIWGPRPDSCCQRDMSLLLWEAISVIQSYCCASPAQSFSGKSPAGLMTIYYSQPGNQLPAFISPRNRVAQLYSRQWLPF
jgi:hypothetical protein